VERIEFLIEMSALEIAQDAEEFMNLRIVSAATR
jgi:hypothetical protein